MEIKPKDIAPVVRIDELNLDKECIRLPTDFVKYSFYAIEKRREQDEAKAKLDGLAAELNKEIRANPSNFGLDKVTESAVNFAIQGHEKYREAHAEFLKAKYESDLAQAVVAALDVKKKSLAMLVELLALGYFAAPKISERGRQAIEEMTKEKVRRRVED